MRVARRRDKITSILANSTEQTNTVNGQAIQKQTAVNPSSNGKHARGKDFARRSHGANERDCRGATRPTREEDECSSSVEARRHQGESGNRSYAAVEDNQGWGAQGDEHTLHRPTATHDAPRP
jgi:hypothetical protein